MLGSPDNPRSVASLIDHTLLKPEAIESDIVRLCGEARLSGFASVCVNPFWIPVVSEQLRGAATRPCSVIGFPLGANETQVKIAEAERALSHGAAELDMVQNIGALRSGKFVFVQQEIHELAELAHAQGALLKVILETSLLDDEQKIAACRLAAEAGADFVKTSTGFSGGGATERDVRLMRLTVGPSIGVKASGGIRSLEALRHMVEAGATRIGTSSGLQILRELADGSPDPLAPQPAADGHSQPY